MPISFLQRLFVILEIWYTACMKRNDIADNEFAEPAQPTKSRLILLAILLFALIAVVVVLMIGVSNRTAEPSETLPTPASAETVPQIQAGYAGLAVWFLDVGQGDCAALCSPNGKTMLIDAGPAGSFSILRNFFDQHGITRLDVAVCSHLHEDHIGSMAEVLDAYPVDALYMPPFEVESSTYAELLASAERNNVPVHAVYASATSTIPWDEVTEVRILSPYEVQYTDANEASLMLRILYGSTGVLFAGDAGELAERLAVKALPNHYLKADVLKVGHHGSATSTSKKFLSAVAPSIAVISVGKENGYDLPDDTVLRRLDTAGVKVLRTDEQGTILIALDGVRSWVIE